MHEYFKWFGLNFGINLRYFAISAHISPIMLSFGLLWFLIVDLHISGQVLGDNGEVEAKPILRACTTSPIGLRWIIHAVQGKAQNAALGKQMSMAGQSHHGLWWSDFPQLFRFPSQPFVFPRDFSVYAAIFPFKGGYICLYSGYTFHSSSHLSFIF